MTHSDHNHEVYSKTVFGFWLYLLSDFMLFATLFAAYAVLSGSTFGGKTPRQLFDLGYTTSQTVTLLISTFTIGIGGAYAHRGNKRGVILFFTLSFVLGLIFTLMAMGELSTLIASGSRWDQNAFLSAFFSLIGTFLIHMFFALLWAILLLIPVFRSGLSDVSVRRLTCLRMFWQFLNIIWVFIYTVVYLVGVA